MPPAPSMLHRPPLPATVPMHARTPVSAPLTVAETFASALPSEVCDRLWHRADVRRGVAARADLTPDAWERLAATCGTDPAVRAQLAWHRHAAGHIAAFVRPDDHDDVLVAALLAHPAEAAPAVARLVGLPAAVADLAAAVSSGDDRWEAARSANLPTVLEVALDAPASRSDDEVADLVVSTLARPDIVRPPRSAAPPMLSQSLLRLCLRRPAVAARFVTGDDPWLALPAVLSGVVDPAVVAATLAHRTGDDWVDLAAVFVTCPDTPEACAATVLAGVLAGTPAPARPDPLPASWGRPDRERSDGEHAEVVTALRALPSPWAPRILQALTAVRTPADRPAYWVTPPTGAWTTAFGPRFHHSAVPTPADARVHRSSTMPVSGLSADEARAAAVWLVEQVGGDPARWETVLGLADTFRGTVAQLAAVAPALTDTTPR